MREREREREEEESLLRRGMGWLVGSRKDTYCVAIAKVYRFKRAAKMTTKTNYASSKRTVRKYIYLSQRNMVKTVNLE